MSNTFFIFVLNVFKIDNILFEFANIIFGVPDGSVLGPLTFCFILLPLSDILKYHNTQLYASFNKYHITALCRSMYFHIINLIKNYEFAIV